MYLLHSDSQRWFYLSNQRPSEITLFKNFDSSDDVKSTRELLSLFDFFP